MFYLGDTHGNFNYVKWFIDQRKIRDTNIIHVGDYGIGFIGTEFKERNNMGVFNRWLNERGLTMHVFRGNHDDPKYFNGDYVDVFDNLKFYPDYTVLELEGKRILGVGGALSIDRMLRIKMNESEKRYGNTKRHHWDGVEFELDLDKLVGINDIDIVVTHTAPDFVYPVNDGKNWPHVVKQFMDDDPTLEDDLNKERVIVTEFYNEVMKNNNPTNWFYGHFHTSKITDWRGTQFKLLDINEMVEVVDYTDYEEDLNKKYGEDK